MGYHAEALFRSFASPCFVSMPVRIQCSCGKALQAPDSAVGKAIKCPGCGNVLKVPANGPGGQPVAAPAAAKASAPAKPAAQRSAAAKPTAAAAPATAGGLDDLFDEEGFGKQARPVCPACRKDMTPGAVLCTHCGYHTTEGVRVQAHRTPGVDIDSGTMALEKAKSDMVREKELQHKMEKGAGMPTWMLALILVLLVGTAIIGVVAINMGRRAELEGGNSFNAGRTICLFGYVVCYLVSLIASIIVVVKAFQKDVVTGLLCMFVPFYILYFVATNWQETGKPFLASMTASLIGIGFVVAGIFL